MLLTQNRPWANPIAARMKQRLGAARTELASRIRNQQLHSECFCERRRRQTRVVNRACCAYAMQQM